MLASKPQTAPQILQRLKTRSQFQTVLNGVMVSKTAHFVLHKYVSVDGKGAQKPPERENLVPMQNHPEQLNPVGQQSLDTGVNLFPGGEAWLGALVPKRWAKRAVTRNAIKRQIYNVSACVESSLLKAAYVVRLRAQFEKKLFPSASSAALKAVVAEELFVLFKKSRAPGLVHTLNGVAAARSQ